MRLPLHRTGVRGYYQLGYHPLLLRRSQGGTWVVRQTRSEAWVGCDWWQRHPELNELEFERLGDLRQYLEVLLELDPLNLPRPQLGKITPHPEGGYICRDAWKRPYRLKRSPTQGCWILYDQYYYTITTFPTLRSARQSLHRGDYRAR